jgi:hypothetical protein
VKRKPIFLIVLLDIPSLDRHPAAGGEGTRTFVITSPHPTLPADEDPYRLLELLERFAHEDDGGDSVPWARRLSGIEQRRLRSDLAVVLAEPRLTGEPPDWRELDAILSDYAREAGWDGPAIADSDPVPVEGAYRVHVRPQERRALERASTAVRETARELLVRFLPHHPTSFARVPRGHLKKLPDRKVWQLHLPDGYRLRYLVDEAEAAVHVLFLGPHPDGALTGRAESARATFRRGGRVEPIPSQRRTSK